MKSDFRAERWSCGESEKGGKKEHYFHLCGVRN
jgi:hypothetical protein